MVPVGLVVDSLVRRYDGFKLGPISFRLAPGATLGLLGANGAGKTTLLAGIAGQGRVLSGTATWNEQPLVRGDWRCRTRISYVRDVPALYHDLTVRQTLAFVERLHDTWRAERATELLDVLRLEPGRRVGTLSRGMKAKLGLLLAVAHDVELLLLDEVTAGVDVDTRDEIQRLLRLLASERRVAVLLSSHIFDDVEQVCDGVLILRDGQVAFLGPLEERAALRDLYATFGGR
jgi:ABC-2 type transport system ATP-binding protein